MSFIRASSQQAATTPPLSPQPSSPQIRGANSVSQLMQQVLLATIPGAICLVYFFGVGVIINLLLACASALLFEAAAMAFRQRPIIPYLKDSSALLTAVLLGLALPPYCPWWIVITGIFFAILVAKHVYGGLGYNTFNPAMIGYAVVLISFPVEMNQWPKPLGILTNGQSPVSFVDALQKIFWGVDIDGYAGATPLTELKQRAGQTLADVFNQSPNLQGASFAGPGWEWVNAAFLLGGIYLLYKKVFTWHAPVAMLLSLGMMATFFYDGGSSQSSGSPVLHWFSGATMLGAFFIATDPVTSATSNRGRFVYGIGIGLILFSIRFWGKYPDAVAFAVLTMNFAAPLIDYFTVPRTFGHNHSPRNFIKK